MNPAWWYFGLLVELYLVFPILFRLLQRLGAPWFLVICALATVISRYVLLFGDPMNGHWVQGAFFGARLWEFAFGMVVGQSFAKRPEKSTKLLFSPITLIFGVAIYIAALYTYEIPIEYIVTDALAGTGLFIILTHVTRWMSRVRVVESAVAHVGAYSYGLYLLHQPYVIYIGERVRWMSFAGFLGLACILVPLLALGSIPLEQAVNRVTDLALARLRRPASSAAQPA
jgi:peptidoglycan/LPS O-acetylase OafA/YrhL